jgi:hypothetical protein
MIYWRCKCGKAESWESGMPPQDCQGCDKCGTTLATGPSGHKDRIPHDWKPQFNSDTGAPDRPICRRCYARGPKEGV